MTLKSTIESWFDRGVKEGASHMIVVCDTFDYEDYPVFVDTVEEARKRFNNPGEMQRVMEVYNLKMDKKAQLNQNRVFNF
jgi:hypothetical protein